MSTIRIRKQHINGGYRWSAHSDISFEQLRSRTPFDNRSLKILQDATVAVMGNGSGGGKVALDLARAGVGHLVLCDPGILAAHNLARHLGTVDDLGKPKVEVVARQVLVRVPSVQIDTYQVDLFSNHPLVDPEKIFKKLSMVIGATDRTAVQLAINEWAWRIQVPAVFGGCYESAWGGEVFFTLPGKGTPCLACIRGVISAPVLPAGSFEYSSARSLDDYRGEPGLSSAVDFITDVESQVSLAVLLRETGAPIASLADPRLNFLLVGGALGSGYYRFTRPFDVKYQPLAGPRPGCPICRRDIEEAPFPPQLFEEIPTELSELLFRTEHPG